MLTFMPPPGAVVVDGGKRIPPAEAFQLAQAWGGLLAPRQLPRDFEFRGYYRHEFSGRPVLVSLFASKRREQSISLFQSPSMGMSGMREKQPTVKVLSTTRGRADVMVVGPLPEEELQKVMDSVAPQTP
jgi:hypothetical protein